MFKALVETSRLFGRNAAAIAPEWLERSVPHLCARSYDQEHFERSSGFVRAREKVMLGGLLLHAGRQVDFSRHNPAAAREKFRQAAAQNHPAALRKLGWCFENGIGGEKDLHEAFNCYERSAHLGDAQGNFHAGRCFLEGIGVKPDPAGAVFFFRRGTAMGDRESMRALAECLRTGRGCTADPEMSRKLSEAAEQL